MPHLEVDITELVRKRIPREKLGGLAVGRVKCGICGREHKVDSKAFKKHAKRAREIFSSSMEVGKFHFALSYQVLEMFSLVREGSLSLSIPFDDLFIFFNEDELKSLAKEVDEDLRKIIPMWRDRVSRSVWGKISDIFRSVGISLPAEPPKPPEDEKIIYQQIFLSNKCDLYAFRSNNSSPIEKIKAVFPGKGNLFEKIDPKVTRRFISSPEFGSGITLWLSGDTLAKRVAYLSGLGESYEEWDYKGRGSGREFHLALLLPRKDGGGYNMIVQDLFKYKRTAKGWRGSRKTYYVIDPEKFEVVDTISGQKVFATIKKKLNNGQKEISS